MIMPFHPLADIFPLREPKPELKAFKNVDDGSVRYLLMPGGIDPSLSPYYIDDFPPRENGGHLDPYFRRAARDMPARFADWSRGEPKAMSRLNTCFGRPALRYREPTIKRDWLFV